MFKEQKVAVVMPAYNAEKTIARTYREIVDQGIVDVIIIVDDASDDETVEIANKLRSDNAKTIIQAHEKNRGYGGNQKTCYKLALAEGADIVILIHPDYQYTPKLIPAMAGMITSGIYSCVLASRVLVAGALKGGMPFWKYVINRFLTAMENLIIGAGLSEYHTGYRAFSRKLLENIHLDSNSNDFIFDNEIILQILWCKYPIGEISCPTNYFPEASVIGFWSGAKYGFGCIYAALIYRLARMRLIKSGLFYERSTD